MIRQPTCERNKAFFSVVLRNRKTANKGINFSLYMYRDQPRWVGVIMTEF